MTEGPLRTLSEIAPDPRPALGQPHPRSVPRRLRFVNFLAPSLAPLYRFVARYCGARLGLEADLETGSTYDLLARGEFEVAFVCSPPYLRLRRDPAPPLELLAAPVLQGERYGGRPVYYSDVVVRRDSRLHCFADLRGCRWCYNEPESYSGYQVVRHRLAEMGLGLGFFGRVIESGSHLRSLDMILAGDADAAAIDSQVLEVALRDHPGLAEGLRVIAALGPSPVQAVVVSTRLPEPLRWALRSSLLAMGDDPRAVPHLAGGLVERFVAVDDRHYEPIARMTAAADRAGLIRLA